MSEQTTGRPTKYLPEYAEQAYKLCLLGMTNDELAVFFEVNTDTIHQWRKDYKEFSDAVCNGREIADGEVVKSFYKRANGYEYEETTFEKITPGDNLQDGEIKGDLYKKKVVVKHLPADPGAALNWLKNRQGKRWRDKQTIEFENLSDNDLDKIIDKLKTAKNGTENKG